MSKNSLLTMLGVLVVITTVGAVIAQSFTSDLPVALQENSTAPQNQFQESSPAAALETLGATESAAPLEQTSTDNTSQTDSLTLTATQSGQTAFQLLQATAAVKFQQYDFGVFITEINGTAGTAQNFWALYVNNALSQTGADQTVLEPGDVVEFRYDTIQ
jgi:hypothetical protein